MSKLKHVQNGDGTHYGYRFECPGCEEPHVKDDGSVGQSPLCHSFVRDGRIEFLSDCTHKLAGQTVDLPDRSEP